MKPSPNKVYLLNQKGNKVKLIAINSEHWTTVQIDRTGYYRSFDVSLMKKSIRNNGNHIEILPYINEHIWKGTPALRVKDFVSEDEVENLLSCFDISSDRHESNENVTGMMKLMEIAVKAMSPGINDPGTAINAINKIGQLLYKFLEFPEVISESAADSKLIITSHTVSAQELMRIFIQPIRLYSRQDNSVLYVLLKSLQFIKNNPNISYQNKTVIDIELEALKIDIEKNIENPFDKNSLIELFED